MDLYYEVFRDLVDSVLSGFNGTIFAYGELDFFNTRKSNF